MKRVLVLVFIGITGWAQAQTNLPISSFMRLKFGTTSEEAMQQMTSKGAVYDAKQSKKTSYVFRHAPFGPLNSDHAYFRYTTSGLFEGGAYFSTDRERTFQLYNEVKRIIAIAYGEGADTRRFSSNFSDGDGRELEAIETGYGLVSTKWIEDPVNNKNNTIELSIGPDLSIWLRFTDIMAAGKK